MENKEIKKRNWLAVHAFTRSGSGSHNDRSKYNRKEKHRKDLRRG